MRAALIAYFVLVFLLAWWPWNVWLLIGTAYCWSLHRKINADLPEGAG